MIFGHDPVQMDALRYAARGVHLVRGGFARNPG